MTGPPGLSAGSATHASRDESTEPGDFRAQPAVRQRVNFPMPGEHSCRGSARRMAQREPTPRICGTGLGRSALTCRAGHPFFSLCRPCDRSLPLASGGRDISRLLRQRRRMGSQTNGCVEFPRPLAHSERAKSMTEHNDGMPFGRLGATLGTLGKVDMVAGRDWLPAVRLLQWNSGIAQAHSFGRSRAGQTSGRLDTEAARAGPRAGEWLRNSARSLDSRWA